MVAATNALIELIFSSSKPPCQGERGDIGRSRIPIARTRRLKDRAVSAIIVAHQIGRCRLPREGLDNLLRQRWLPSRLRSPRDTYSGSDEQMFGAK